MSFFIKEMPFKHRVGCSHLVHKCHTTLRSAWMSNNIQDIASGCKLSHVKTNKVKIEGYQDEDKQHRKGNTNSKVYFLPDFFVSAFYRILFKFIKT